MAKVTVTGMKELRRQLLQTIPETVKKEVQASLEKSGAEMVSMAKSLAPVDDGDLRDSIKMYTAGQTTPGGKKPVGDLAVRVTASIGYARYVEFGRKESAEEGEMAPRPFFFPSYRAIRKRIRSRTTRAINAAFKRLLK